MIFILFGEILRTTPPHNTPNRMNDLNKFDSAGMEEDEEMRIQLQATTDAALQLEVENQELRRRLLESSMQNISIKTNFIL